MDYGERYTDKKISAVNRELRKTFRTAQAELKKKLADFEKRHARENQRKKEQLADGKISQQDYKDWLTGQVFIRNQWQANLRQVCQVMQDCNKQAMNIVNTSRFDVFAENYNYNAWQAERSIAVSFTLYNAESVARLINGDPQMLPEWKVDEPKDYRWNQKRVNNIIRQAIIQGEGIPEITDRLCSELATSNEAKMRMFARTALGAAQSAGRQKQMEDAAAMGIEVHKRWIAAHDSRTRDAHRDLDGQEVPYDKPFDSELGEIMFPKDPTAEPANVFNCRCSMRTIYPKYEDRSKKYGEGETIDGQTYEEWKKGKLTKERAEYQREQQNAPFPISFAEWKAERIKKQANEKKAKLVRKAMENHIITDGIEDGHRDMVIDSLVNTNEKALSLVMRTAGNVHVTWLDKPDSPNGVAHYSYGTGRITMYTHDYYGNKFTDEDIMRTLWHEYGHFIDDAKVSGSGFGRDTESGRLNGIHFMVRENGQYEEAAAKDMNAFFKRIGLSDHYESRYDEGSYSAWVFKDGKPIDVRHPDYETQYELMNAFDKWANDWCGFTRAYNYEYELGLPRMPEYSDYFERYKTPKRGIEREREKYKGAAEAYNKAWDEANKAQQEFWKTHDPKQVTKEKEELIKQAERRKFALAGAADTFDGGSSGAFCNVIAWGGHDADYYCRDYNGLKEGIANIHSVFVREPELEIEAMNALCPEMYSLIMGVLKK